MSSSKVVPSGGNVIFHAENQVCLNPGFEVMQGAIFEAYIDFCN